MTILEQIAERQILDAQRDGAFDQLAGRGRRLDLQDDDGVPPEWRAAYRLLKNAGLAPDWVSRGREIDAERARLESGLAEGRRADEGLLAEVAMLNRRIDDFNLAVPHASLQKLRLRARRVGEREA
jgi:hypothetical protein